MARDSLHPLMHPTERVDCGVVLAGECVLVLDRGDVALRPGRADEAAAAVLWLASPAGGFIIGQTIVADGGTPISDGH